MPNWTRAATLEECPPGSALETVVRGRIVALFNVDGDVYALDGVCPHQGGPLGKGRLHGCIVTCPWHGWQFDVATGQHQTSASLRHPRYDVKLDEGAIWVDVAEVEPS